MRYLLALDSSREKQSALLYDLESHHVITNFLSSEEQPEAQKLKRQQRSSQYLAQLAEAFESIDFDLKQLDLLALCVGPGSFTGIRSAMTVAMTLATELDLPVFSVNYFELVRFAHSLGSLDPVLLAAGKSDYFLSLDSNYDDISTNFYTEDHHGIEQKFIENPSLALAQLCQKSLAEEGNKILVRYDKLSPYYLREPSIGKKH